MIRKLLILAVVLTVSACGNNKITLRKTEVVNYHSLGNGVADISLKLYDNETFLFKLESLAQPESDDEPIKISEIGTYSSDGGWKTLHFKKDRKSTRLNSSHVRISYAVFCLKKKNNKTDILPKDKTKIDEE